jgi:hypothetical protein
LNYYNCKSEIFRSQSYQANISVRHSTSLKSIVSNLLIKHNQYSVRPNYLVITMDYRRGNSNESNGDIKGGKGYKKTKAWRAYKRRTPKSGAGTNNVGTTSAKPKLVRRSSIFRTWLIRVVLFIIIGLFCAVTIRWGLTSLNQFMNDNFSNTNNASLSSNKGSADTHEHRFTFEVPASDPTAVSKSTNFEVSGISVSQYRWASSDVIVELKAWKANPGRTTDYSELVRVTGINLEGIALLSESQSAIVCNGNTTNSVEYFKDLWVSNKSRVLVYTDAENEQVALAIYATSLAGEGMVDAIADSLSCASF